MFHDRATIHVAAGRGGDGGLSFRREKYVPKGGPDGGDGGPGGDVVLVADPDLRDLSAFRTRKLLPAGGGEPGRGALKQGARGGGEAGGGALKRAASGEELEVRVPVGTQVTDADGLLVAALADAAARAVV